MAADARMARACARLDQAFERLALDDGAEPLSPQPSIPRSLLDKAGYFDAFPGAAIPVAEGAAFFPPAACYHVYESLAGSRLETPRVFTLACTCGRRESDADAARGRLERFTMREIVFVGPADWVEDRRRDWMDRVTRFAAGAGLAAEMAPATDVFFGDPGRGRRLIQQLKQLKFELRAKAPGGGDMAIASFNLHEGFFAGRFEITMGGGSAAASGCVAFGIERWALACLAQGLDDF